MLELTMRLIASLAVVVGLLLLLARVAGRRFAGRQGAAVQVLHRQPLSRTASVAVLAVGSRILVVGTTDHQVQLLTELDPEDLPELSDLPELTGAPELTVEPTLVELDAQDVVTAFPQEPAALVAARPAGAHRAAARRRPAQQGALTGSVLSPDTWRQALAAATGKAS